MSESYYHRVFNTVDRDGKTPLMLAIETQNHRSAKKIIRNGGDLSIVDRLGHNAVWYIIQYIPDRLDEIVGESRSYDGRVQSWFNSCADGSDVTGHISDGVPINIVNQRGMTGLMIASNHGRLNVVKTLIEHCVNINICDYDGENAAHFAARNGHTDILEELSKVGIDLNQVNERGNNPLMIAARNGYVETVQFLISEGSSLNLLNYRGRNALIKATIGGHDDVVEQLLISGVNPNNDAELKTNAMIEAVKSGRTQILDILIKFGMRVDILNRNGSTPLMFAVFDLEMTERLIKAGANHKIVNEDGFTAQEIAQEQNCEEVFEYLDSLP